ncbi:YciI family protein [Tenggerimyces flavus]|uniref:YciI family protein n=1 Tax=Tenggerimyces flavus TaxID=1708749 RepID=A0ABV7YF06_9ACTN|nr:YciI family protein [Tenggerimyces flavus]MBM7787170.1 hypothetical protein [Tenggerimyces flavus]
MRYALLIQDNPAIYPTLTPSELEQISKEYLAIRDVPGVVDGGQLQGPETATTVRVQDGDALLTDGPFADTKEVFAGYYIVEADNIDVALQVAARIPAARLGGAVEVRPLVEKPGM